MAGPVAGAGVAPNNGAELEVEAPDAAPKLNPVVAGAAVVVVGAAAGDPNENPPPAGAGVFVLALVPPKLNAIFRSRKLQVLTL